MNTARWTSTVTPILLHRMLGTTYFQMEELYTQIQIIIITMFKELGIVVFVCVTITITRRAFGAYSPANFPIVKETRWKQVLEFILLCQVRFWSYCYGLVLKSTYPGPASVYSVEYTDWSENNSDLLGSLECLTQNSPPTSVTWLRDGVPVEVDGVGVEMIQTVTERRSYSRYNNTLLIRDAAQLAGSHTYNCTVSNAAGNSTNWVDTTLTGMSNYANV